MSQNSFHAHCTRNILSLHARRLLLSGAAKAGAGIATMLMLTAQTTRAGSATWDSNPTSNWNTAANWTPNTVPNGPTHIATFGFSNTTALSLSADTEVNRIIFNSGASAYVVTVSPGLELTISGAGITNNSGILQNFVIDADGADSTGSITFANSASAGSSTVFTNNGGTVGDNPGGSTFFSNTSTAGNGTFYNNGGAYNGQVSFFDSSTAGNGTFYNNGSTVSGGSGGDTEFYNSSTAGNGTFYNNSGIGAFGGYMYFFDSSTAGNGTFTINGAASGGTHGYMSFLDSSNAGNGAFTNNGSSVDGAYGGEIEFSGSATASNGTFTSNGGNADGAYGSVIEFHGSATAGDGAFTINGTAVSGAGSCATYFFDSSSVGNGTFTINGGTVNGAYGGFVFFYDAATAGDGAFTFNGGTVAGAGASYIYFLDMSTANNSTLIVNGGLGGGAGTELRFDQEASGGTARVQVFGNGSLDISFHNPPGVTVGSLEGDGDVFLGAMKLTVGSNNLSTVFSGVIQDGGFTGGAGGSLRKTGTGTLRLSGANMYTGPTTVKAGRLLANNSSGSGTGSGAVTVNNGSVLGGTGRISGPVTVNLGAALLGGNATASGGSLKVANNVTLNTGSIIQLVLGASGAHSSLRRTGGTWTFAPNQKFTFLDLGAQPGVYNNIITGLAADPGGEASWTITNAGFAGTFSYDGAGNIDLDLTTASGPGLQLTSAFTRKTHGTAGIFNINLPLTGEPGVECRSSGGNHTLRFTFTNNVTSGNASVTTGIGTVPAVSPITSYTVTPTSGIFTPLSGATVQTLADGNSDDSFYPLAPLGFNFIYAGITYTEVSASTNGWMRLGELANAERENDLTSAGARPLVAPLWDDLLVQGSVSYLTEGTAPNRVFTIQWRNMAWNYASLSPVISFQVKLYETTNRVRFVYQPESGVVSDGSASIGITGTPRGAGNFLSLSDSGPSPTVSSTTEINDIATKPASGQTYTFTPGNPVSVFAGNTMTVNLTGVADVQKITVTLSNVTDSFGQVLPDKTVSVNMLRGDTTGNKLVNASDIGQTKSRSGQAASASNFRSDVTVSGTINASDIGLVKSRSGSSVP